MKLKLVGLIFFGFLFLFPLSSVKAQEEEKPLEAGRTIDKNDKNRRPNLLSELNLNQEQIREIRRVNQENRPLIRLAQQRLREANRNLDEAIYADSIDEADLQTRIKELQNAQIEIIKARSSSELAVRRVLTVQQLAKFRDLRRRFMENNAARPNQRPKGLRNFSNRRFNNRRQPLPAPNN